MEPIILRNKVESVRFEMSAPKIIILLNSCLSVRDVQDII